MSTETYEQVRARADGPGLYESHYLMGNAPDRGPAFWLKYNFLVPVDRSQPGIAELWAVLWEGPGRPPVVIKQVLPMGAFSTHSGKLHLAGNGCLLTGTEAVGSCHDERHRASWSLHLAALQPPLYHYPYGVLYRLGFPKKKIVTPAPELLVDGTLRLDGHEWSVQGWKGQRGHNWGSEHALRYAYGSALAGQGDDRLLFDGFTASIRLGPLASPLLSAAILRLGEREVAFNAPRTWWNRKVTLDYPRWSATFESGGVRVHSEFTLDPAEIAALHYLHPDGKVSYCANSKYARARFVVTEGGTERHYETDCADLEFLMPEPLPGVVYHGDAVIPRPST